jgi:hypothetical protein
MIVAIFVITINPTEAREHTAFLLMLVVIMKMMDMR